MKQYSVTTINFLGALFEALSARFDGDETTCLELLYQARGEVESIVENGSSDAKDAAEDMATIITRLLVDR